MSPLFLWAAAAIASGAPAPAPATGVLMVRFTELAPVGRVQVAVFGSAAAWKVHNRPVRSQVVNVTSSSAEVRFEGLPAGTYGVMAYHDRNNNGRLDTLPVGLPTEPYGFSNNARGVFGPPPWPAASVALRAGETVAQAIRLK